MPLSAKYQCSLIGGVGCQLRHRTHMCATFFQAALFSAQLREKEYPKNGLVLKKVEELTDLTNYLAIRQIPIVWCERVFGRAPTLWL
ncbi:hypothetical protein Mmc1_1505 [Magnetococcus marinus MC-1]|uniref:Uncharacterized protein n=1 Tax=Magnetococcus marinus (strain ATCC BAA-1437 / JCM 17883 / MC-1) TaxID=156889 RepID=A0L7S1_MAGMM|nr:hypothetical protein Mmc1_1505 [Magnetococcus marinus MC-1]